MGLGRPLVVKNPSVAAPLSESVTVFLPISGFLMTSLFQGETSFVSPLLSALALQLTESLPLPVEALSLLLSYLL